MRYLLIASLVLMVASVATAATPGVVPNSTLAAMGISGLQPMSDVQGMDVRGMGSFRVTAVTSTASLCDKGVTACATATTGSKCGVAVAVVVYPVSAHICICGSTICLNNAVIAVGVAVGK